MEENQKSSINATNIIQDKLLQERDMGNFEGMKLEEMYKLLDEHYQFKPDSGFVSIYKRKELQVDNYEIVINFFHNIHNLT